MNFKFSHHHNFILYMRQSWTPQEHMYEVIASKTYIKARNKLHAKYSLHFGR